MLIKKLIKYFIGILLSILLLISIYLGFLCHKIYFIDSFSSKLNIIKVCEELPSQYLPSYLWISLDENMKENLVLDQNKRVEFYTALIILCGNKIESNAEQSILFYEMVQKQDAKVLVRKLNLFKNTNIYRELSLTERHAIEIWIEIFNNKLKTDIKV